MVTLATSIHWRTLQGRGLRVGMGNPETVCLGLYGIELLEKNSMLIELGSGKVLTSPRFGEVSFAVRLSLLTATIASILSVLVSVPVAYIFSRYASFGKNFFDTLLDLPIVLSSIALGAMLLIFFNTPFGKQIDQWPGPFVFEVKGIILAQFFVVVGLSIRLLGYL